MRSRLLIIVLLTGLTACACAQELTIVADGQSDYEIVIGEGPTKIARVAADELQTWLAEATDVALPIVTEADPARRHIFVGGAALPEDAGVDVATLEREAFVVRTVGEDLVLAGMDDGIHPEKIAHTTAPTSCGTMNAVYDFLEDHVGVRWYWHDDLGTIVPQTDTLTVPALDYEEAPRFVYRTLPYGPQADGEQVASGTWGRRNRLGKSTSTYHAHAFFRHLPIDEYADEHPEYYALVDGRRVTRYYMSHHGGQVCTTNPQVINIFADSCIEYFERFPGRTMCAVSPNDGSGFCQCDDCTALDPGLWPEGQGRDGKPLMADRMMTFYNQIAEKTSAVFPDCTLGAYVYSYYSLPPERVKPHPNLALVLAINSAWRGGSEEYWAQDREKIDGWATVHDYMFMYDIFYTSGARGFPAPIVEHTKHYFEHIDDLGYQGGYLYIAPTWESLGPGAYLMSKLLWDPHADADAIVDEWYADLYGEAADNVRAYEELVEERWVAAVAGALGDASVEAQYFLDKGGADEMRGTLLHCWRPMLAEAREILQHAEQAADTDAVRARVGRVVDQFDFAEASTLALEGIARFEMSREPDEAVATAVRESIKRREEMLERIGNTWSPHFRDWVRSNDDRRRSPLRPTAAYFTLAGEAARESLYAPRAAEAPTIDGVADDAAWADAPRGEMRENMGAKDPEAPTRVAMTFDDSAVYLLAECAEPNMEALKLEKVGHDNAQLFKTDNVELILAPGGPDAGYYQFAVNAGGSRWEGYHPDAETTEADWSPAWESAVTVGEEGWTAEIAVPLESIEVQPIAEGDTWRFNVHRTRRSTANPDEYQALSPTLGGFHQPNLFATLNFGTPPSGRNVLRRWDAEDYQVGEDVGKTLRVGGRGEYAVEIADDRAYESEKAIKVTVGPDSHASFTWYPGQLEPGSYRLALRYYADPLGPPPDNENTRALPITRVIFRDMQGKAVSESDQYSWERSPAEPADGAWADHVHVFRTLPGTERFSVTVFIHREGTYWIDDVSLVRF